MFEPGDFLVFQIESAYGILRILAVDENAGDAVWHVRTYNDFFPDVEMAESAIDASAASLKVADRHLAMTDRAFHGTQVAKLVNVPLNDEETSAIKEWRSNGGEITDRSVRLMLGIR